MYQAKKSEQNNYYSNSSQKFYFGMSNFFSPQKSVNFSARTHKKSLALAFRADGTYPGSFSDHAIFLLSNTGL